MKEENPVALAILSLSEVAKMGLMIYFTLSQQSGKTEEQIKAEIPIEWAKFQLRKPETIPEV